jgi:hypothetical protein
MELRIATTFHADAVITFREDGIDECNVTLLLLLLKLFAEKPSDNWTTALKIAPAVESCFYKFDANITCCTCYQNNISIIIRSHCLLMAVQLSFNSRISSSKLAICWRASGSIIQLTFLWSTQKFCFPWIITLANTFSN